MFTPAQPLTRGQCPMKAPPTAAALPAPGENGAAAEVMLSEQGPLQGAGTRQGEAMWQGKAVRSKAASSRG